MMRAFFSRFLIPGMKKIEVSKNESKSETGAE
jgi:hypothetical protein